MQKTIDQKIIKIFAFNEMFQTFLIQPSKCDFQAKRLQAVKRTVCKQ